MNYVRGCINQIEAVRPEMPTVRENGCWTATDSYVVRKHSLIFEKKKMLVLNSFFFSLYLGSCLSTMVCANR